MDSYYCLFCAEEVTSREEALLCDGCDRWQHRRCQTGITREQYREAVRSGLEVIWRCLYCSASSTPIAESTRLSYEDMDTFDIPASFETETELCQLCLRNLDQQQHLASLVLSVYKTFCFVSQSNNRATLVSFILIDLLRGQTIRQHLYRLFIYLLVCRRIDFTCVGEST